MDSRQKRPHSALSSLPLLVLLATGASSLAQPGKISLLEPPPPLLPSKLADFTKTAPAPVGEGIGLIDPAQAPVMHEDGVKRYERSEYTSGSIHGTLTAYQFIDTSGAFAAFCASRKPGLTPPAKPLGDHAVTGPDATILQTGANLVIAEFQLPPSKLAPILTELIGRLPKAFGPASQPPLLPSYLPEKNLVPGTARYALGPAAYAAMGGILPASILAFDKSAEAITADYLPHGARGPRGTLTILLYPTPTIAGDESRAIEAQLKSAPLPNARLRREGPMILLASGGFAPAEAQQLVDGIHLRNEVSWNKDMPLEFHSEVKKTASLLQSIAIFSGVGALAAVLLGFFLGFGRAGIRVLMGKPAASEPEFLRIDLSGKPAHHLRGSESSGS